MSCTFYWYNGHYACRKINKDVDEDTYYRYCRDYSYRDCPIFKGDTSSSCYLTTACVEVKGLPDDCKELESLRYFRDNYLINQRNGKDDIAHYYTVAPLLVEKIKERADYVDIFNRIYEELVLPCVKLIEEGKFDETYKLYKSYSLELIDAYGIVN